MGTERTDYDILVSHVQPPIHVKDFDYCAWYNSDGEESRKYGWGESPEKAIADLKQRFEEGYYE